MATDKHWFTSPVLDEKVGNIFSLNFISVDWDTEWAGREKPLFHIRKNVPYFGDGEEQEQLILGVGFGIDQFEIAFSFSPYL